MVSKENAAASLGKVDPSPLLQQFSTFSLRMYCSVVYIGSRVAAVLVYRSRQRFSTTADPSQGGTFEENFARWLAFTVRTFVVKRRRVVKSLICSSSRREQSIAEAIFAEGLDTENCLPTEYSGYASAAAVAAAAAAAV